MNDFSIHPADMRGFTKLLRAARGEIETASQTLRSHYFGSNIEVPDYPGAYVIAASSYIGPSEAVDSYLNVLLRGYERVIAELQDSLAMFEDTDDRNHQDLEYGAREFPNEIESEDNRFEEEQRPHNSIGSRFEYEYTEDVVPAAGYLTDGKDPGKEVLGRVPEFHSNRDEIEWAQAWYMNIEWVVQLLEGTWQTNHERYLAMRELTGPLSNAADNVNNGLQNLEDTWQGKTANSGSTRVAALARDTINCNDQLVAWHQANELYHESLDLFIDYLSDVVPIFIWEVGLAMHVVPSSSSPNRGNPPTIADIEWDKDFSELGKELADKLVALAKTTGYIDLAAKFGMLKGIHGLFEQILVHTAMVIAQSAVAYPQPGGDLITVATDTAARLELDYPLRNVER